MSTGSPRDSNNGGGSGGSMSTEDLYATVQAIQREVRGGASRMDVCHAHELFARKYPKLVDKLCEGDVDQQQLRYILRMYESVQNGSHTVETASVAVGKKMFDQYVGGNLPPAGPASGAAAASGGGGGGRPDIQFSINGKPAGSS